jgi:hypothetical protein
VARHLEWVAGGDHPFSFELRQPWWPPFYATTFFLPELDVKITNEGDELPDTSFGLYVRAYDGPIGSIPSLTDDWVDTVHEPVKGPWRTGESKRISFTVRARSLPHEGTYVLKILATKFVPLGTLREEIMRVVGEDDVPEVTGKAVMRSSLWALENQGVDPDAPQPGAFRGESLHTIHVVDYFRVEPLSSVLTFMVATGSLLGALTGIVLAVAAVWG